ncbi:MAG TPA: hypothetical protein VLE43_06790, partial [Candidatus Saccharimonadia bacterium]|nr:hypothetical protein [Candidatus Saccharimonadia bacterium]
MSARSSAALSHADAAVGQEQQQLEALRRCRASRARAFRWIHMEWPKLHDEAVTFWMLWYARKDMRQAARDCEALDAQCVRLGLPPIYVAAAVAFDAPGALNSLYYRAWKEVCGHARGANLFGAAVQRGEIETARDKQLLD